MLTPLFTANRWDWQPHCELGQSTWLCCVHVPYCCSCKAMPWTSHLAPLSGAVAKLAGINLRKFGSFSYWLDKPSFHNWGKTCWCAHHNLLLGFPTGRLYIYNSYINTAPPHSHTTATVTCLGLDASNRLKCSPSFVGRHGSHLDFSGPIYLLGIPRWAYPIRRIAGEALSFTLLLVRLDGCNAMH
jgi:hypothetical protein